MKLSRKNVEWFNGQPVDCNNYFLCFKMIELPMIEIVFFQTGKYETHFDFYL